MKEDLKKICNYSDKQMSHPTAQLMYVDTFSSEDEEYQRMVKRQNRELVVDAILDDKVEELNIFKENQVTDVSQQYNPTSQMGIISPKIIKISLNAQKFESYEKTWNEVIDFLNQNTQGPKSLQHGNQSLDYKLINEYETDYRKIISKILMSSNIIAMDGRIGPGTSVIYGKNLLPYMSRFKDNGLTTYYSKLIDDDKVIVCRGCNIDGPGLLLIDNSQGGHYFFNQTPNWQKQYCWFKII